jgi:hypothetical protein
MDTLALQPHRVGASSIPVPFPQGLSHRPCGGEMRSKRRRSIIDLALPLGILSLDMVFLVARSCKQGTVVFETIWSDAVKTMPLGLIRAVLAADSSSMFALPLDPLKPISRPRGDREVESSL